MFKISQQYRDIFFTLLNQMWRLVSGPVVLLLIPLFLTPIQQGYWYLFISLSALSILADLGLTNIILQFSAHEFAFLNFTSDGLLEGEEIHLKRLGSFFRFTIKWISTICLIVFPIIYIVGIYFFSRDQVLETYLLPWTLYAAGSVINFFNNSILSFIEGLNKIETVQKIRLRVAIIYTATIAIILVMGGNIYALAFGLLLSAASIFLSVFGIFKKLLKQILKESKGFIYSWKKEVLPLFTRYAVSGIFGYILFQIYTPLMHYFHGPVYSGKVGITLALVMAVFNMSNIWMYTIIPKMNILISKKLWSELDTIFIKRLLFSIGTYIVITLGIFLFVAFFKNIWVIPRVIDRFLPGIPFIIVFASYFIQIMLNAWGLYLRGHKKEPYVYMFVVCAICAVVSTYLIGLYLSPLWFLTGFFFVCILQLPFGYIIYKKNKILWHKG